MDKQVLVEIIFKVSIVSNFTFYKIYTLDL